MKKQYFLMAAAATMFAACSQTDMVNEIPEKAPKAIEFESGFVNKATRSENSSTSYGETFSQHHGSFGVWGYKTKGSESTQIFKEDRVEVSDGQYNITTTTAYWDANADNYQFFASAPHQNDRKDDETWTFVEATNETPAHFKTSVTLYTDETNKDQVTHQSVLPYKKGTNKNQDLLIAVDKVIQPIDFNKTVELEFIHILSRLNVVISNNNDNFRLFKITVGDLPSSGDFDESLESGDDLRKGTIKRWTNQGTPANFTVTFDGDEAKKKGSKVHVMQTLVVPQMVRYESTITTQPWIEVEYGFTTSQTGVFDKMTRKINLAEVFGYTNADGMEYDAAGNDKTDEELYFYEGWQNTLTLEVLTNEIKFSASVAVWDTKYTGSYTIQ